ncbi:MAG: leucine-rich repeat protein [Eubacterium sp.]|nr:leucine-rich repeat protein [Eubacterium sp.]
MKALNKAICVFLALVIAVAQVQIISFAKNDNVPSYQTTQTDVISQDGNWKYDIALDKNDEKRVWITDYFGTEKTEFTVPSMIDGMLVQSVEMSLTANVVNYARKCSKIVFEENIERIAGNFVFGLKNAQIVLPSSLLMIDSDTFYSSKNLTINFPEGLCSIGDNAFKGCTFSNTDIVFPESMKYIGNAAFENTNIESVKIGSKANFSPSNFSQTAGVYYESLPTYPCTPFSNCSSLTSVKIDENNPYFKTEDGVIYTADEKELVFINSHARNFVIPKGVEYICSGALNNKTFESLFLPSTIQNFAGVTFNGTKIGKLSFEEDWTYDRIGTNNFKNSKIDEIKIPKSVKVIEYDAFYKCSIKKLEFEEDSELREIGARAFKSNDFETLDLTNCKLLMEAQEEAFCGNKQMTSVDMTDVPLEALATMMFCHCYELREFKISKYTKIIGTEAFEYDSKLEKIDLSNIAQCYTMAFRNCDKINIDDYILSSSITEDGYEYNEFENHISLVGYTGESNELIMPDTINSKPVTDIVWSANMVFRNRKLKSIKLPSEIAFISSRAFQYTSVSEISEFPKTLCFIGEYAFSGCNFKNVKLNEGLEYVLSCAFQWCPLEKMVVPDSVIYYCAGMYETESSITFGKNVRNIKETLDITNAEYRARNVYISEENPYYCFENGVLYNRNKTRIYKYYPFYNIFEIKYNYQIPEDVKIIDDLAFNECKILRDLNVPAGVEYIGEKAFCRSSVKSVKFADDFKTETLNRTFLYCDNLKTVNFGKAKVKNLIYTFADSGLSNLDIPDSVENITGAYEMTNLASVTELKLPENLKVLGNWSFGESHLGIKELSIPKGVTSLGYSAFSRCPLLKTIDFGNVKFLSRLTFENCVSLESVDLTGIKYIAENHWSGTFSKCYNLKKITFNRTDGIYNIEDGANKNNDIIETVVIGNGISNVNSKAFADCKNLETAVISDFVENIADDAFENCDKMTIICTNHSNAMLYAQRNNIKYKAFKILPIPDQSYTGKEVKPQLHITVGESELKLGKDYSVSYSNNIKPGTARATAVGLGDYSIYASTVKFNIVKHQHQFTKKTVKPTYEAKGYTLYICTCGYSYKSDIKSKLTVPSTSVKKLTKGKKEIRVTFKKVKNISGYQIQYSQYKNFKKSKTVKRSADKSSAKLKNLKSKKRYYVRIRTYKKVGKKTYYSSWSAAKSIKTK